MQCFSSAAAPQRRSIYVQGVLDSVLEARAIGAHSEINKRVAARHTIHYKGVLAQEEGRWKRCRHCLHCPCKFVCAAFGHDHLHETETPWQPLHVGNNVSVAHSPQTADLNAAVQQDGASSTKRHQR